MALKTFEKVLEIQAMFIVKALNLLSAICWGKPVEQIMASLRTGDLKFEWTNNLLF